MLFDDFVRLDFRSVVRLHVVDCVRQTIATTLANTDTDTERTEGTDMRVQKEIAQ